MAKKLNIIEEIQELIQQIKKEYQEGIDFEDIVIKDKKFKDYESGCLKIISPRLKDFCRKRFNFPLGANDYLDYDKGYQVNHFFYRTGREDRHDYLCLSIDGRPVEYFFSFQKDFEEWRKKNPENRWDSPEEKNPKNCSVCGEMLLLKDGRMRLWNDHCRIIGVNDDGYSLKLSKPHVLAYFHPDCAKKYFADKEQPNQNEVSRLKEKILHNLDKICLDLRCDLANAEVLKQEGVEKNYKWKIRSDWDEWTEKVYKVEIEGEEIELNTDKSAAINPGSYEQREIKRALMQEIKQNPSEWKIAEREENPEECEGGDYIIKHKSGRRHWDGGFYRFWGGVSENEKMGKEWDKIKATLKGYKISASDNLNNSELEKIKKIFKEHNISKITFENGQLFIEYNNKVNSIKQVKVNNQELQELEKYCKEHNESVIDSQKLGISSNNDTNSEPNKGNHKLVIGLAIGVGVTILVGIIIYFVRKRKNK